ncbi:MAG: filamentous hemagglutinin N-terminal domain-containing protein [Rhodocyclaceae bacterium]|nr:filamentous hemagglutinin N-terminal domain-containing protein [Rhodocyclaceae bacterium]
MNHTYRLVWNEENQRYVPAPECARTRGKRSGGVLWSVVHALAAAFAPPRVAQAPAENALPSGGQVVAGQAGIRQSGNRMTVDQASSRAVIDWQGFDIGSQAAVHFNQPSADAVALNRVLAGDASRIHGQLTANGQVWLVNPKGVIFGAGSRVSVGGLVASTMDITNADFMAGKAVFDRDGAIGGIENHGQITAADGGLVALLAPAVKNDGIVSARLGKVVLAAGERIALDIDADGLLSVAVDPAAVKTLIENRQLIVADGGEVVMTGRAANLLSASVVTKHGTVQARTMAGREGRILLLADMEHGRTEVSGTLDASAPDGGNGGFIETSAAKVSFDDAVLITTKAGKNGKNGRWLIDPSDFTIAESGGDITGALLSSQLGEGDVEIQSSLGGAGGGGDIHVNDAVSWSENTLTLTAARDINMGSSQKTENKAR